MTPGTEEGPADRRRRCDGLNERNAPRVRARTRARRPAVLDNQSPAFGLRPLAGVRVGSYDPTPLAGVTVPSLGYPVVFAPEGPSMAAALLYPDLVLFNCRPQSGELRKHSPVPITPPAGRFTGNV